RPHTRLSSDLPRALARLLGRLAVEAGGLVLGLGGIFAHFLTPERPHQPDRPMFDEAPHVLAPHQRQELPELGAIQVIQHAAVARLLGRHLFEQLRRAWILLAQSFRDVEVYAAVLLLITDGESEDFLL